MARLPPLPTLDWSDDAPFSREKDDVYFSGDGLSEKRHVFLTGCGLPERWANAERFTVGELGFGTGLNFLGLLDLWRNTRSSPMARLDVISFEGLLMPAEAAARVHARWPELAALSDELVANWPVRARGPQRLTFDGGVTLTLFIDEISASLPEARASVDAWFLDGFAPSKNPEMWSADVMAHIARLSAPGARAATYTVAGEVRRNLEAAGFSVAKMPGHGRKRERLEAQLLSVPERERSDTAGGAEDDGMGGGPPPGSTGTTAPHLISTDVTSAHAAPPPLGGGRRRVSIIGAGIAGACAARAFLARDCEVTVHDAGSAPGSGASGNPIALVMPRLDAADGPQARALLAAYLHARRFYGTLGSHAAQPLDAEHRARGDRERLRFAKLMADPPVDETLLSAFNSADPGAAVLHRGAIAVNPAAALPALLDGATLRLNSRIASLSDIDTDLVIVCAGIGASTIAGVEIPPLEGRLGQIECADTQGAPNAIADGGYAVEAFGKLVFGATFESTDGEPQVTEAARAQNLETLARLRPDLSPTRLASRAAIRATTQDRFPFAGPPPNAANEKAPGSTPAPSQSVRLIGGLGARGFLWAPLLAELLASEVFGEPSPLEASAAKTVDPGRFLARAIRRGI